ncbi:MAG TPA: VTT domain-containing protein [Terriglobales bacterium]|nr:VTT domain-containing protein [Terriglobales bacterium]
MESRLALAIVSAWTWLRRLRGPGLILLGLADNSVIPLPGSMDVLTIVLAASHRNWWFYYSFMATAGAVIGGYLTYRLGREGGKETLERRVSRNKVEKLYQTFERRGFLAVAVPAMLPPPVPIVPFLLAAGALQYPRKKFLASLAFGRAVRFTIVGFLAAHYGPQIIEFFSTYYELTLYTLIALAIVGAIAGLWVYLRYRRNRRESGRPTQRTSKARSRNGGVSGPNLDRTTRLR